MRCCFCCQLFALLHHKISQYYIISSKEPALPRLASLNLLPQRGITPTLPPPPQTYTHTHKMENNEEGTRTPPKCKTYILNCSTCHERFASTKCVDPDEKHIHSQPQELTSCLQGGQLRAKLEGFATNCWHCDPEAQLDFTIRSTRTRNNSMASRGTGSMRRKVDSTVTRASSIRRKVNQRQSEGSTRIKAVARRSSTTTVLNMARIGRALRRWKNGLSGLRLSGCFASRQRDRGEKIPEEEKPLPPRPVSAQTLDAWKLPRMFAPIDT